MTARALLRVQTTGRHDPRGHAEDDRSAARRGPRDGGPAGAHLSPDRGALQGQGLLQHRLRDQEARAGEGRRDGVDEQEGRRRVAGVVGFQVRVQAPRPPSPTRRRRRRAAATARSRRRTEFAAGRGRTAARPVKFASRRADDGVMEGSQPMPLRARARRAWRARDPHGCLRGAGRVRAHPQARRRRGSRRWRRTSSSSAPRCCARGGRRRCGASAPPGCASPAPWRCGAWATCTSRWPSGSLEAVPIPSPADIGYLALYPGVYAGLVLLYRTRGGADRRSLWVDGAVGALALAALAATDALRNARRRARRLRDGGRDESRIPGRRPAAARARRRRRRDDRLAPRAAPGRGSPAASRSSRSPTPCTSMRTPSGSTATAGSSTRAGRSRR